MTKRHPWYKRLWMLFKKHNIFYTMQLVTFVDKKDNTKYTLLNNGTVVIHAKDNIKELRPITSIDAAKLDYFEKMLLSYE